jgi:hypothetical protein
VPGLPLPVRGTATAVDVSRPRWPDIPGYPVPELKQPSPRIWLQHVYFQLFVEPEVLQKYMTQELGLPAPLLGSAKHCIFWYVKTDWGNTRDQLPTNLCPCRHLAAASLRPEFRRDDQIYSLGSGGVYKHNHHKNSRTHRQYHYGEDNTKNRYPGKRPTCCYHALASG